MSTDYSQQQNNGGGDNGSGGGTGDAGADLQSQISGGGAETEFVVSEEKKPATQGLIFLAVLVVVGIGGTYFMYQRQGPSAAVAATPEAQKAEATINTFLTSGPDGIKMMQTMLKDRFKLAFHRQNKEMQTYVLSIGKNGFKAKESKTEGDMAMEPNQAAMSVTISRAPISQLVNMLGQIVRAPILDSTGLTGRYDLTLNIAKYAADMAERGKEIQMDPLALIVPILQEEFGLKLESKKVPLDLLVIDHVEKAPIEN